MIHKQFLLVVLAVILLALQLSVNISAANTTGRVIHVAKTGLDSNDGNENSPLLTISKAETLAQHGDRIIVHKGTYREMIIFHSGGTSMDSRITYTAASGDNVIIKGSERIESWVKQGGNIWRAEIAESVFMGFNPFTIWINKESPTAHLGGVYLNNNPLKEKLTITEVGQIVGGWFTGQENGRTILWANFGKLNPNKELTEINVRPAAFSTINSGVSYIVLDGFKITQIASPMATINGEQPGAIAVNGGTHWLVQNCSLSDCKSVAISIGQTGHFYPNANPGNPEYRDLSRNISEVGHHVIRHNHIFRCGQAGIYGLLHGTCSEISDNLIEDINVNNEFSTEETAGIRLAMAVDVILNHNLIRRVNGTTEGGYGLFLGPLFQGARISRNVISNTRRSCIYLYNNHGPALFDNNILSGPGKESKEGIKMESAEANVFVQNLFYDCGFSNIRIPGKTFATSNYLAHSLVIKQTIPALPRDDRWYSNLFIKGGLDQLDGDADCEADYNVYSDNASTCSWGDKHSKIVVGSAKFKLVDSADSVGLYINNKSIPKVSCPTLDPSFIGFFALSKQFIEYSDGKAITIDKDFLDSSTSELSRFPGPFYQYSKLGSIVPLFNCQK
ncbi:MAG: right-handed parallel beta-helix repeat-containing protein [Paludibacter sp.]|nr:right-handed parallel beta-helix repeat-containing protein [Paludibacter sp.]